MGQQARSASPSAPTTEASEDARLGEDWPVVIDPVLRRSQRAAVRKGSLRREVHRGQGTHQDGRHGDLGLQYPWNKGATRQASRRNSHATGACAGSVRRAGTLSATITTR